ncbi:hypothetical protein Q9L42_006885 [Methylomarinum sp. Ch1-1]|uniref:Outer membrane protein beta-barrel domain-containing protein n=1 Tax=Methylomarinum roseum TaxID=3067653 RepID=A0AAU7NY07_9GAMM|nr:hypothetical protein [Methylomarinum sp. Ch1-1]MDP4522060.1 hypothetical protein [Methylomarinum sp. Ch1-1]
MTFKKTNVALGVAAATLTMAGAMVSPQAAAHSKAERVADATAKKTEALEMQVNQMAAMMKAMQAELNRVKAASTDATSVNAAKVQELDQWMSSVKSAPVHVASKDHTFSVRGGWMQFDDNRGSTAGLAGSGLGQDVLTSDTDDDAFYYGGAIDFNLNNDMFGLMDDTSSIIELGIEYAELTDDKVNGLQSVITGTAGTDLQQRVTVNMLRISAATKIKFMHGSKFRPWIIPAGLDINIISPPSDAVTVLNTGMQFGAGAEYEILDGIVLGADSRYHWSPDDVDGVDTDGFTVGGSLGFRF